ncbi:hypothetical protein F4X90_15470, partial [Candidatus Poribacteria bacterium]|nr:hypothetical protein [Candidatus Poribacteria bacterium]
MNKPAIIALSFTLTAALTATVNADSGIQVPLERPSTTGADSGIQPDQLDGFIARLQTRPQPGAVKSKNHVQGRERGTFINFVMGPGIWPQGFFRFTNVSRTNNHRVHFGVFDDDGNVVR